MELKRQTILLILFFSSRAFAATSQDPVFTKQLVVKEAVQTYKNIFAPRLFIQGQFGSVRVNPSARNELVVRIQKTIKYSDSSFRGSAEERLKQAVVRVNPTRDIFEVRAQWLGTKADWALWAVGKERPEIDLVIDAPATMALEIYWRSGDVFVDNRASSLAITSLEGNRSFSNLKSGGVFRFLSGSAKISDVAGQTQIENYASQVTAQNINGPFQIRNFLGSIKLSEIEGTTRFLSVRGSLDLMRSSGNFFAQTDVSQIKVVDFSGPMSMRQNLGSINLKLSHPINLEVQSQGASVKVSVPRTSAADFLCSTERGDLKVPKGFKIQRSESQKFAKGRLTGNEKGRLRITTFTAPIQLLTY